MSRVCRRRTKLIHRSTRLFVYYTIFIAVFSCPSSIEGLGENPSRICKPYLITRSYIGPYIQPYYDTYVSPYSEIAKPYTQTVQDKIVSPAISIGKQSYENYGAPRVEQAWIYGQSQWQKSVKPQLDVAQAQAKKHYDASLAPHVDKASAAAAPYYSAGRDNLILAYNNKVLPAYGASRPYVQKTYAAGHKAVVETGYPYAKWVLATSMSFLNRTLLPRVKILYGENVEPQLVKISQRLGRYRDGKKIMAAVDQVDQSEERISSSSSISSASSSIASVESVASTSTLPDAVPASGAAIQTAEEKKKLVRETVDSDLETWKEKFLHAADTAADDLMDRVDEIVDEQMKNQVQAVGESLIVQLEEAATSQDTKLKKTINGIVNNLPEDATDDNVQVAEESVNHAVRTAGLAIRERAQALRSWKETFSADTRKTVFVAAESTLEVLDGVRDLGLQEIGMRWAWMDGVTYKDWKKYHDMRKNFDQWRNDIGVMAMEHEGLVKVLAAADDIEANGMSVAEEAAAELFRLKEVGAYKIRIGDVSDDWSSRAMPARAASASKKIQESIESIKEQVVGTSQGTAESVYSQVTEQAGSKMSQAVSGSTKPTTEIVASVIQKSVSGFSQTVSEAILGSSTPIAEAASSSIGSMASGASEAVVGSSQPAAKSVISSISKVADDAASTVKEAVVGSSKPAYESVFSDASKRAGSVASDASEAVVGTPTPAYGSTASQASKKVKSALSAASEAVAGSSTPVYESGASKAYSSVNSAASVASDAVSDSSESLSSSISSVVSVASSAASSVAGGSSRKVFAGAMAQEVHSSGPVLDNVVDATESLSDAASSKYAEALAA